MELRPLKTTLVLLLMLATGLAANAATVYSYAFGNFVANGVTSPSPWTGTPDTLATGLSGSSWATNFTSGDFISYDGSCGSACNALSIDGNNYPSNTTYTLTFTINSGYSLNVTGLSFWNRQSTDGPEKAKITINGTTAVNAFTLAGTTGANTGTLTPINSFNNLTGTFTLVITLSNATSSSGTFRLDNFVIDGTVSIASTINQYNVTGGTTGYCAGGSGVTVGLSGSDTGVTYQLLDNGVNVSTTVAGTGSSITFGPQTAAGTYTVVGTKNSNSDTAHMTGNAIITINPLPVVNLTTPAVKCGGTDTLNAGNTGSTFLWSDNSTAQTDIVSASNTYSVTVTNSNTCSASASVSVTINTPQPITFGAPNGSICTGGNYTINASGATTYLWNNSSTTASITVQPSATTTYTVTGTTGSCVATAAFTVNVGAGIADTVTTQICAGLSYAGHSTTGTFTDTYIAVGGCDSVRTLNLTILPVSNTTTNQTICAGQSYLGHTSTGNYSDTLTSVHGCDSIITLALVVQPALGQTYSQTICAGQTYQGYSSTGNYSDTLISTVSGCDSIITLALTVLPPLGQSVSKSICSGQSYLGHSTPGTYSDTLTSVNNCDSIITLQLSVASQVTSSVTASICAGESYDGHTTAGTFVDTLSSSGGCDSIRTLNLTILPAVNGSSTTQTICNGSSYNGYTVAGNYNDTLSSVNGCDSVVALTLIVLPQPSIAISWSICAKDTFMGHTTSGNYTDTLTSSSGCDSIVYLQLTVNALPHVTLYLTFDTVCNNSAVINMSGGSPAGGYYSGQGIVDTQFVPSVAPLGWDTIYYNYTDSNGCHKDRYEFAYTEDCDSTLGIDEPASTLFTIMPNPAQDYLAVENTNLHGSYLINLYDMLGRQLLTQAVANQAGSGKTTLNLRQLPAGVYLLNIVQGNNKIYNARVIKE